MDPALEGQLKAAAAILGPAAAIIGGIVGAAGLLVLLDAGGGSINGSLNPVTAE